MGTRVTGTTTALRAVVFLCMAGPAVTGDPARGWGIGGPPTSIGIAEDEAREDWRSYRIVHPQPLFPLEHAWSLFDFRYSSFSYYGLGRETTRFLPGWQIIRAIEGGACVDCLQEIAIVLSPSRDAYVFGRDEDIDDFSELVASTKGAVRDAAEAMDLAKLYLSVQGIAYHNAIVSRAEDIPALGFYRRPMPPTVPARMSEVARSFEGRVRPPHVEALGPGRFRVTVYVWNVLREELTKATFVVQSDGQMTIEREVIPRAKQE